MPSSALISVLARSFLAGEFTVEAVHARALRTLGRPWRWILPLATRFVQTFSAGTRPRHRDAVQFLNRDLDFQRACQRYRNKLAIAEWLTEPQRMQPVHAARTWDLPVIESVGDLAHWLSVHPGELEWFADLKDLGNKLRRSRLQHYRYRTVTKRSGGLRLIESPKSDLKVLQRRLLSGILDRIPVHPAVHGFVNGRSIVTYASPHAAQTVVLRLDLEDFFPTFPAARVQALFRTLGYPDPVSDRLAGICTNSAPRDPWNDRLPQIERKQWYEARLMYARPHLPQGAPTSPALSNLMAYRLDCRLSSLAKTASSAYTRYADDLAFSGGEPFSCGVERFSAHAAAIALEEGFSVNHHKTRIMRRSKRQQLAGIVVNQEPSLRRSDLDLLEAILTNCVRFSPESQNRALSPDFRAHLLGRIGFVEMVNPKKGQRLKAIFEQIDWSKS